jgi:50S ribosomal protein L16 3-hydroxylase
MVEPLLGGISPRHFLRDYWQKKPLLVRQAIPEFRGVISRDQAFSLACDFDAESRLVWRAASGWQMRHGPFKAKDFRRRGPWTVLVQGLNLLDDAADALLHRFDFVPWARLDDLMVSYATDGGGVGPHFDSYDVFLIQGMGRRRWQIGAQRDLEIIEGAPLRILKHFQIEQEWVLEPGDMLYLPPSYAHNGIAEGECMTYSVGFRAPAAQEVATQFLVHLQDRLQMAGRYCDPGLALPRHPGEIGSDMVDQVGDIIDRIAWNRQGVRDFLGCYLTEPKSHVFFDPPDPPLGHKAFAACVAKGGIRLHRKSQLLFADKSFYLNGEVIEVPRSDRATVRELADRRRLPALADPGVTALAMFYDWYCDGFIVPGGR